MILLTTGEDTLKSAFILIKKNRGNRVAPRILIRELAPINLSRVIDKFREAIFICPYIQKIYGKNTN
jgi:glucose-6-phosphate isomerase